jgi:hypothetical protein
MIVIKHPGISMGEADRAYTWRRWWVELAKSVTDFGQLTSTRLTGIPSSRTRDREQVELV